MTVLQYAKRIFLTVAHFFAAFLIYLIPQFCYLIQKYRFYDFELDPYTAKIVGWICLVLTFFAFYSAFRLMTIHNPFLRENYYAIESRPRTFTKKLRFFLCSPLFWIETAAFCILNALLSLQAVNMALADLFLSANSHPLTESLLLGGLLMVLFFLQIPARLTAIAYWNHHPMEAKTDPKPKKSKKKEAVKNFTQEAFVTACIYVCGGLMLSNVLPILLAFFPLLKELFTDTTFGGFIILLIVAPLIYRPIRTLLKRRAFLKKLRITCSTPDISLSKIDLPYRSVFQITDSESFTVTVSGKPYACKLIGSIYRNAPISIFPGGKGAIARHIRFARATLFTRVTEFEFGFEAECDKILIINPVPKQIWKTVGGKSALIDNGDVVDGYKIFTAGGFLGAIERRCIDR